MSAELISHWPVLVTLTVGSDEVDGDGRLTEAAVERLFAAARDEYFARCFALDPAQVELASVSVQVGRGTVGRDEHGVPTEVTVSTGVLEVFPSSFTMNARVRGTGTTDGDGGALGTGLCSLEVSGGEVTVAMRDEFIALAQSAKFLH